MQSNRNIRDAMKIEIFRRTVHVGGKYYKIRSLCIISIRSDHNPIKFYYNYQGSTVSKVLVIGYWLCITDSSSNYAYTLPVVLYSARSLNHVHDSNYCQASQL